jgi:hypothetical protein
MSGAITATTLAAVGIGAAGSVASGLIGANAAGNAADTQAAAANHAADLQSQESQKALDFQKQQYATSQAQQAPWLQAGQGGLSALQYGLGTGGAANGSGVAQGSLTTPYGQSFTAPTGLTEQNDPGYQARLQLGTDAIQRSAAARGGVVTGGTAKDLATYGQDYASNEYGNVYNRALNSFDTNFNAYNTNQTNQFNKLAALSGVGQQTATQLAGQGQNASNNVTSNLLGTAQNIGQQYNNAGAATASGYVGGANAYGSALNGIGSNISNLGLLSQMGSMGGGNPYMNLANSQHLATQSSYVPTLNNNLTTMIGS